VSRSPLRRLVARASLATLLAAVTAGCAQTFDATSLGVPVTMASPPAGADTAGNQFSVTRKATYAFWGVARLGQPRLSDALAQQLVGGKEVRNLRIKVTSKWTDVLVTVLTGGLLVPRSVTYEGVVVGR